MIGLVLNADGRRILREFERPLWKSLGKTVGGYIEIVHAVGLPEPLVMIVDEEGLYKERPVNFAASILYGAAIHQVPIVGDVVIVKFGMTEDGLDLVGLEDEDLKVLSEIVGRWTDGE